MIRIAAALVLFAFPALTAMPATAETLLERGT